MLSPRILLKMAAGDVAQCMCMVLQFSLESIPGLCLCEQSFQITVGRGGKDYCWEWNSAS